MTDTDKLEPGWYWVRPFAGYDWQPMEFTKYRCWNFIDVDDFREPAIIGPRLTPPGEG